MKTKDVSPLDTIGRKSGMTVPEGYFADFAKRMTESLPRQPWEEGEAAQSVADVPVRSWWQKARPYVYMAAMFAGIWLMMNMFTLIPSARRAASGSLTAQTEVVPPAEVPTEMMAVALQDETFMQDYMDDYADDNLYDLLYEDGYVPASLTSGDTSI